jgi:hypothetical protein
VRYTNNSIRISPALFRATAARSRVCKYVPRDAVLLLQRYFFYKSSDLMLQRREEPVYHEETVIGILSRSRVRGANRNDLASPSLDFHEAYPA